MNNIIGRHRIRANFYHLVSLAYVVVMSLWLMGYLSDTTSTITGFSLFVIDYLAQLYDPHPVNPGPWFKAHFHRFIDDDDNDKTMGNISFGNVFIVGILLMTVVISAICLVISIMELNP